MSEVVIAAVAAGLVALALVGLLYVRPRLQERAREKQAEEDLERLLASGRATVKGVLSTAARVREHGLGGVVRSSIEQLAGWAEDEKPDVRRLAARDGTITIVFSDIEDSTAINDRVGDRAWLRMLGAHDAAVRGRIERHGGHIVKSQGDGFMIVFAEPEEAVRGAIDIQRAIADQRRLRKRGIRVRIGIHTGQAVAKDGDLFGRNVAFAARVAAEANGGEILVSSEVADAARDVAGIGFADPREVELKGLAGAHRLFAVVAE